jgi:hypothetical protein
MNVRAPVAWDLDLADSYSQVIVMEPFRCGILLQLWILQLKESQVLLKWLHGAESLLLSGGPEIPYYEI